MAPVRDARRVEVDDAVAVDVDAGAQHAHQLHDVDASLSVAVVLVAHGISAGGAEALGQLDRAVAVLVDAAAAGRDRHARRVIQRERQRRERAEAVARLVDADDRDAARRRERRHRAGEEVLVVAGAVADDHDRPAAGRRRAARQVDVEVDGLAAGRRRHVGARRDRRDVLARVRAEVGRDVPAERDPADRARHDARLVEVAGRRRERRAGRHLAVERDRRDAREVEDRSAAARAEVEVGRRRRRRREDRVVQPLHQVGRALRVKRTDRGDVRSLDPRAASGPLRPEQLAAVPRRLRVTLRAEVVAVGLKVVAGAHGVAVAVPDRRGSPRARNGCAREAPRRRARGACASRRPKPPD